MDPFWQVLGVICFALFFLTLYFGERILTWIERSQEYKHQEKVGQHTEAGPQTRPALQRPEEASPDYPYDQGYGPQMSGAERLLDEGQEKEDIHEHS